MLLNGFSFEVLVDESPLVEYTIPDSITNITTICKSYALQENAPRSTIISSDLNTFIVAEPGRKFKLRFFSTKANSKNPMMAETLIDGQFDRTYRGLKSNDVQIQEYFVNATRDKKLEFTFSNSILDDSSSNSNSHTIPNTRGGIGAISIYFYKGRPIPRKNTIIPSFNIQQIKVKEDKKSFGIQCTTAFVSQDLCNNPCRHAEMIKDGDPIAVLHLHYRPAFWFALRGVQVQKPKLPFNGVNQVNNLSQSNSKLNSNIKNEIKNENVCTNNQQIGINKIEKEKNRNNKRPFDENNEIEVIDLTCDVESAETVGKRARVMD